MTAAWQPTASDPHGPYAAWESALETAAGGPARMVPVLARLVPSGTMDLADAITASLAHPDADFAPHERDLLHTERALAPTGWPHEVRFVAYLPRSALTALPDHWDVLRIGPGFLPGEAPPPPAPCNLCTTEGDLDPSQPVIALIDEGIGFLNARFRSAPEKTRLLGLWLQADERRPHSPTGPANDIRLGRTLTEAEIDAMLATGAQEADLYRHLSRALYPAPAHSALLRRIGHGSHVLDLAAGAAFSDPMAQSPLLAVQLPPASIAETAGRRMDAHLIQGLRWILAETLRRANGTDLPPLIINLSIGALAGPGDATEFLAEWLSYEIARHHRLAPGAELRITGAYGNARLSRLTARAEARIPHPVTLDWRILPDDATSSFLELRVDQTLTAGLSLTLTPPIGSGLPTLTADWPATPGAHSLTSPTGPIAAATFIAEQGGQALCHLSLAPTKGPNRAAPGLWRVTLRTTQNEPVRVIARVQRDDTPFGHAPLGRQSWLDHPDGWTWDAESRDYTRPDTSDPACPVTRQGSAVSFAGCGSPQVYLVGSVRPQGAGWLPSRFSAEGAATLIRPGESTSPTLSAPGDSGPTLGGILATGLLTGTTARLAGTSMAAPAVARRLADYFRTTPPADRSPQAEREALAGQGNWSPTPDPRTGHAILKTA
jgi:hypothetical protein